VLAHERGVGFTFVAPGAEYTGSAPTNALIVAKTSPIHGPKDLIGKTIGVIALGDINTIAIRAWLERSGVDAKSVRFLELPNPQMSAAIDRGAVDRRDRVLTALAPAMQTGPRLPVSRIARFRSTSRSNAVVREERLGGGASRHRCALHRAGHRSAALGEQNHADSARYSSADAKLDPDLVASMTRATFAPKLEDTLIQPLIDLMAKYGRIAARFRQATCT